MSFVTLHQVRIEIQNIKRNDKYFLGPANSPCKSVDLYASGSFVRSVDTSLRIRRQRSETMYEIR